MSTPDGNLWIVLSGSNDEPVYAHKVKIQHDHPGAGDCFITLCGMHYAARHGPHIWDVDPGELPLAVAKDNCLQCLKEL